jgi:DNA-binding NarL/FixJ family response regulator
MGGVKRKPLKVVVADDHSIMAEGICNLISSDKIKVVATANDGREALEKVEEHSPDLAILDFLMPNLNGLEAFKEIKRKKPGVKVILLTSVSDNDVLEKAQKLGLNGYVLKDNTRKELLEAVKIVMSGKSYISPLIGTRKARHEITMDERAKIMLAVGRLTPMEKKVLELLPKLKTSKKIAQELYLSPLTVQNHRAHICEKLNISGANALLAFATENKALLSSGR